ncbi:hypothetical protein J2X36_004984 [Methylobacterium sp. BE186]|uniref:hypothetical protein n=1 Tax=Methylobacterium sp. BE186 TaxID=2817715 RepID=UPI0028628EFE|nr:hypothetical protein [Methylobacterium sp. BE186]MDR7040203.1 hypothetical protein [Methylobacterium sp. BE186]
MTIVQWAEHLSGSPLAASLTASITLLLAAVAASRAAGPAPRPGLCPVPARSAAAGRGRARRG